MGQQNDITLFCSQLQSCHYKMLETYIDKRLLIIIYTPSDYNVTCNKNIAKFTMNRSVHFRPLPSKCKYVSSNWLILHVQYVVLTILN